MTAEFGPVAVALLMIAAWRDVATRTIPDALSLFLVAAGGLSRLFEGLSELLLSVAIASLFFVLLLAVYSRGLMGGGDVKLITAFTVGLPPFDSYRFIVATAIAGSLLAVFYLLASRGRLTLLPVRRASPLRRVVAVEGWRIRRRAPLPYGVAIAAGGTYVLVHSGGF